MADLYENFINHELVSVIDFKKKNITIDELYIHVEEKLNDFIYKMGNKTNYDTLKILLKAQIESSDHNYIMSIPVLSFSAMALNISLASFVVSSFGSGGIREWIYRGYNVWAIIALVLIVIIIVCILYVAVYSSKTFKDSKNIFYKKKILTICLEMLQNYEIEYSNKREFHVVIERK